MSPEQPLHRPAHPYWSRALLLVLALLLSLLMAEALTRLANAANLVDLTPSLAELPESDEGVGDLADLDSIADDNRLYQSDPRLHHRMRPGWSGFFPEEIMQQVGRTQVSIRTNSLGLRNGEIPVPKPAGLYRILVLGDSVTFGWGVRQEDTYTNQLASLLVTLRPQQQFDVVNAGVSGYGTWQELLWLQEWAPILAPDLVIVQVHLNDPLDNLWGTFGESRIDDSWLGQHSMLARLVQRLLAGNQMGTGDSCDRDWTVGTERVCWDETKRLLADLGQVTASHGARLVVLPSPMQWQVEPGVRDARAWVDLSHYQAELASFAGDRGFTFVDPLAGFQAARATNNESLFLNVGHPNEAGQRILAQELFSQLAQAGLLS